MEKSEISNNLLYTQKHFDLLINLNKHTLNYIYPLDEILDLITESAVNGLDIDRASYWKIADEKLVCINLYDKNVNAHVIQDDLMARDFPVYFKALSEGIAIVANDAKTNNYTKEFKDSYLIPNGITDMLDLPIRENGKVIGVLCCEHKNDPRNWNATDFAFARAIADLLTLLLEQNKNKEIQEKLIESERKLSLLTQNSTDGFVVVEAGKITYMSESYTAFFGHTFEEVSNFTTAEIFEFFHPEDRKLITETIYGNLEAKKTNFTYEYRLKLKNNKYSWRQENVAVIYDEFGVYSKMLIISRDITSSKEDKSKIERLYAITKVQNEKLVDFTYIVSHNIRSNSCNISMLLDLIKDSDDESEKQNYYELLRKSNEKLTETLFFLNETINIQNNKNIVKSFVNIKEIVQKTIENHDYLLKDIIDITIDISDDLDIYTIPSYFESILHNLINNSIKYRSYSRKATVAIKADRFESSIIITVKDNGIGINLEKNDNKLFGMYKTFNGNDDAVGLGLYMTKNHVEHLKGTIDVESQIDQGSTFKVTFYD